MIAFYILISIGLAIWALVRTYTLETKLREQKRLIDVILRGRSEAPQTKSPDTIDPAPTVTTPITSLKAASVYQPRATTIAEPDDDGPLKSSRITDDIPPKPSVVSESLRWLTGGNVFVRIGVLVLFFGIAFLLKYASEHHALPPQVRLAGAAFTALVLLGLGWGLRLRSRGYALVLQGGGIGVLYLAIFASLHLYHLLPGGVVFLLLCAVVICGMLLAVMQDAIWLAIMSVLGGFLAPVLSSTGDGSHITLFSYYLVLNAGILGVAFYRSWRGLNVLGFVCTFIIASAWGALRYQPTLFASTEPFLVTFFLMYTGIALLYALRQSSVRLEYYADGTLIFGTPLVGFSLQSAMVYGWEYALAYSALALCLFYLVLALLIHRKGPRTLRVLTEAFLALGVGFGTLAIPFALDAYWTSAAWALEGAGIAWSGMRQRRMLLIASGLLLQLAGGIAFLRYVQPSSAVPMPVLNTETLGIMLIAIAGLFSAWYLDRCARSQPSDATKLYQPLSLYMLLWGLLWWAHAAIEESARLAPTNSVAHLHVLLSFATFSLTLFSFCSRSLPWPNLGITGVLQTPAVLITLLALMAFDGHPAQSWGWLVWPLALVAVFVILRHLEEQESTRTYMPLWHALSLLATISAITWECAWRLRMLHDSIWYLPVYGLLPGLVLLALATGARRWLPWPVDRQAPAYTGWSALALAIFLWFWLLMVNCQTDSTKTAFAYIPLLNPLDATQALVLTAMALWVLALHRGRAMFSMAAQSSVSTGPLAFCVGFTVFACINCALLRALCYWLPLPFDWDDLVGSQVVQMSVSILWTLCALTLMVAAARRRWRTVWFAGACLMALEIGKLFIVDLASAGSLERIVSFIVVGALLLLVGYFSPLPPAAKTASE